MFDELRSREGGWRKPAAVVFDCDGVLIESVDIKTEAFTELFADYPEHHEAIANHHQENLGISRFEKFEWIYRELLGKRLAEDESRGLGQRFSDLVFERVVRCPAVAGTEPALRRLRADGMPTFIASGTPQEELEVVISARGWHRFFQGIYGSPSSKPDILESIAEDLAIGPSRLIFVGDGWSDYEAARKTGASFIWRETAAQAARFAAYDGPRMADLTELGERWAARPSEAAS